MKHLAMLVLLCAASAAMAQQAQRPQPREQGGGGPPPEALEACKGKKDGDTVQMKTPRGDSISASCRMVAVPVRPNGDGKGPPPQQQR